VELQAALHFYLTIMRLLCIDVEDAMRDVDIAGEDVWKELSEQNDKGYVDILGEPLLEPIWPLPGPAEYPPDDGTGARALAPDCVAAQFEDQTQRLVWLQQRLKYTFTHKWMLFEVVMHPSAGHLELQAVPSAASSGGGIQSSQQKTFWNGDYERLEYLGDAIIEYLTFSYAFLRKTALACFGVDEWICASAVGMDRETSDVVARLEHKYQRDGAAQQRAGKGNSQSLNNYFDVSASASRKKVKATGTNPLSLPKMFADVFEALVAAVGKDLQATRDVFLGSLLGTIWRDALADVCHESELTIEQFDADVDAADQDEIIDSLFSDDDEGEAARG
ncbi:hypothetical protein PybrP1_004964, partial [[Pythium] brassicae (nom. inval.)]